MLAVFASLRNFGQYIVKNLSSGCYGDSDRTVKIDFLDSLFVRN
ncbi:MAG: hypothetical protein V7K41_04650 [Nostoc sp.]